jgi:threonine/homoserine/homoserine lactone efflux protein
MALNPKAAVFFVAVVPQFVQPGPGASTRVALLLLLYGALCLAFWSGFVLLLDRAQELVRRPRVRSCMQRVTGCALIGLGVRLAAR